jgi:hypothetical protein
VLGFDVPQHALDLGGAGRAPDGAHLADQLVGIREPWRLPDLVGAAIENQLKLEAADLRGHFGHSTRQLYGHVPHRLAAGGRVDR